MPVSGAEPHGWLPDADDDGTVSFGDAGYISGVISSGHGHGRVIGHVSASQTGTNYAVFMEEDLEVYEGDAAQVKFWLEPEVPQDSGDMVGLSANTFDLGQGAGYATTASDYSGFPINPWGYTWDGSNPNETSMGIGATFDYVDGEGVEAYGLRLKGWGYEPATPAWDLVDEFEQEYVGLIHDAVACTVTASEVIKNEYREGVHPENGKPVLFKDFEWKVTVTDVDACTVVQWRNGLAAGAKPDPNDGGTIKSFYQEFEQYDTVIAGTSNGKWVVDSVDTLSEYGSANITVDAVNNTITVRDKPFLASVYETPSSVHHYEMGYMDVAFKTAIMPRGRVDAHARLNIKPEALPENGILTPLPNVTVTVNGVKKPAVTVATLADNAPIDWAFASRVYDWTFDGSFDFDGAVVDFDY